jgi:hypothetical protein
MIEIIVPYEYDLHEVIDVDEFTTNTVLVQITCKDCTDEMILLTV